MAITQTPTEPATRQLDPEEWWRFFDSQAQALLSMGGAEFLRRWEAGEWDGIADDPEHRDILYLAMLGAGERA